MDRPKNSPWRNLREGRTSAHIAMRRDLIALAVMGLALIVTAAVFGGGFVYGLFLGAFLMFLPKLWTDLCAWLDIEVVWDRFGPPSRKPHGRHSQQAGKNTGHHPRPGARNKA